LAWRRRPETPCRILALSIVVSEGADAETCSTVCPTEALRLQDGRLVAEPERCHVCLACMAACGPEAVLVVPGWECPGGESGAGGG